MRNSDTQPEISVGHPYLDITDELFFTGPAVEVTAIREVDGRVVGGGKLGSVTRRIQDTFNQVVRGQLPQYRRSLSFVRQPVASRT